MTCSKACFKFPSFLFIPLPPFIPPSFLTYLRLIGRRARSGLSVIRTGSPSRNPHSLSLSRKGRERAVACESSKRICCEAPSKAAPTDVEVGREVACRDPQKRRSSCESGGEDGREAREGKAVEAPVLIHIQPHPTNKHVPVPSARTVACSRHESASPTSPP
jgi:hypothetical protein